MTEVLDLRPERTETSSAPLIELARSGWRWTQIGVGWTLVATGILMAPLPGPLGLPVSLLGLVLVLRNSFGAKRLFIRMQHRNPRTISPVRRLLRRDADVKAIAWQQTLRMEKRVLPREWRRAVQWRRRYFRRR